MVAVKNKVFVCALVLVFALVCASEPCNDFGNIELPCDCTKDELGGILINCDHVVFSREFPLLPYRYRIHGYSQKHVGYQSLPAQLFTASDIPLMKVDFSHNLLRRLTDRLLDGVESSLKELRLSHNLLGDQLNTVFTTNELRGMKMLTELHLDHNAIVEIEDGILKGCQSLQVLTLDGNSLSRIPTGAIRGPEKLQTLHLNHNNIGEVHSGALAPQPALQSVDLSHNFISELHPDGLFGLDELLVLNLTHNRISNIPKGFFNRLVNLRELYLDHNLLEAFPRDAISALPRLSYLSLNANNIKSISSAQLPSLPSLQFLHLERNKIDSLSPGTFKKLPNLKHLSVCANAIRKIEDETFDGLQMLEELRMNDNNILSIPFDALGRLPVLQQLHLDYNRIKVLSSRSLGNLTVLQHLSLAYNLIDTIPDGTFSNLKFLKTLNLHGNQLKTLVQSNLVGPEESLEELDLGSNELTRIYKLRLPRLSRLDLSNNNVSSINIDVFDSVPQLSNINLSRNALSNISKGLFKADLDSIDLSHNLLQEVQFQDLPVSSISLKGNNFKEIAAEAFYNLPNLSTLDLSYNSLFTIRSRAFHKLPSLSTLYLQHNNLASFKDDSFSGDSSNLQTLDLSHNQITYLVSTAFVKHPKLNWLHVGYNRLNAFPGNIVKNVTMLHYLNLQNNLLKTLDEFEFANMGSLRSLTLSHNQIELVSDNVFRNSTQLQHLDLSSNQIESLPENAFTGIGTLNLNLENNNINTLPADIFNRTKVQKLQMINLGNNMFQEIPIKALAKQYFFLDTLSLASNKIQDIPSNANILVNIKNMDLSFNPLTPESIEHVLDEPKTVRHLNMAGTGITDIQVFEMPFLKTLNLSHNSIETFKENMFARSLLLTTLDVSHNAIPNLISGLATIWPSLHHLSVLDVSNNPLSYVIRGDFQYLPKLQVLKLNNLETCTKIEREAFKSLPRLRELSLFGYRGLTSLDTRGILTHLPALESLEIELKTRIMGSDIRAAFSPRLSNLRVSGRTVRSLSPGALAGINGPNINIGITGTSITSLPPSLFFSTPKSSMIRLNIINNQISNLKEQILAVFEDRNIELVGLPYNPIFCDCHIKDLKRWLIRRQTKGLISEDLKSVDCTEPQYLRGISLLRVPEQELSCDGRRSTTTEAIAVTTEPTSTRSEPDIIWSVAPTEEDDDDDQVSEQQTDNFSKAGLNNMDALIIGIVGGVVAFIAILIIIICIVRLKQSDHQYRGGPLVGPLALRAQGNCTCLKPPPHGFPFYPPYHGTLPHSGTLTPKMLPPPTPFDTMSRHSSYYPNPPYYVTFPDSDNEHR